MVSFFVELKFDNDYYNYDYTVDKGNKTEGFMYLEPPPPDRENVKIYITAISTDGKRSEPLVFTNKEWWSKALVARYGYVMEHTFSIE